MPSSGLVTDQRISTWRLNTQRLSGSPAESASAVVSELLGVQAENHGQASWALAARAQDVTEQSFARDFDAGLILRTHVLRTTWHYVSPADIRWLLDLTGPRVGRLLRSQLRELELDEAALDRAAAHIVDSLAGGDHLTRDALGDRLAAEGFASDGRRLMLVAAHAELSGLICSGVMEGSAHTYALLDERAPAGRRLDRDEALAELAFRYFTGHGPATERDLAYWATMTLTDVRAGLASVADQLESFDHDGRTYWFGQPAPPEPSGSTAQLLQILDELYRGYQDSRWVLDVAGLAGRGREPSIGMVLVDGQYAGGMRRSLTSGGVVFELGLRRNLDEAELVAITAVADRYGQFLGRSPSVVIDSP